jgi:hypothetical protein
VSFKVVKFVLLCRKKNLKHVSNLSPENRSAGSEMICHKNSKM